MSKAVIFSGQGAQFVGMGKDLAAACPDCRGLYEQADEVLGYGLSKICFEGPEEALTKSNHCQPAIFVSSMACYQALKGMVGDLSFAGTAGLSLGEWSALHAAGALSFEDTLRVLEARGRFMQEACDERDGSMLSIIGLDMAALETICTETGVTIANLNSTAQTVLSGERAGIERATALATEAGAKRAIPLNVAGAFHSPLMASAAERLAETLAGVTFNEPAMPVLANVTGLPHSAEDMRATMIKQVTGSVHWYQSIEWLQAHGVDTYVECGPGKVLTGLIKRIAKGAALHNVQDATTLEAAAAALQG